MKQNIRFCTTPDGVRLAYAVSGEGPPIVMSATWLTHLEHQWRSLAWRPWLDIFTRDHKVLRHELTRLRSLGSQGWQSFLRELDLRSRMRG